jgi:outer membrane protein insertion porin family
LIVLIAILVCLGLPSRALAQFRGTSTFPNSGPRVELVVSTNPVFIEDVCFEGLQALTASDVENEFREHLAGLTKGALLVSANVQKGAKIITQMLADVGYMNAHVEVRIENASAKSRRITFVVYEGPPAVIREIHFKGNKVFSEDALLSQLQLVTVMSHDVYSRSTLEYDLNNPRNFMRSRGYLQARILEPKLNVLNGNLTIIVPVEEGRLYRVGEITVLGSKRISAEQIKELIGLKKGDIADGKRVSDVLFEDLKSLYGNMGYPLYSAEPDPTFLDNPNVENEGILDLEIAINEGACFKIFSIEFQGNKKLSEKELRRFLLFKEGDTYNEQLIRDSVRSLNESGLVEPLNFDGSFDFETDDDAGSLRLTIKVQENED